MRKSDSFSQHKNAPARKICVLSNVLLFCALTLPFLCHAIFMFWAQLQKTGGSAGGLDQMSEAGSSDTLTVPLFCYTFVIFHAQLQKAEDSVCRLDQRSGAGCAFLTCTKFKLLKLLTYTNVMQLQKAGGSAGRLDQMSGAGSSETFQAGMSLRGLGTGEPERLQDRSFCICDTMKAGSPEIFSGG